jgi:hypothetical protein
MHWSQLQTILWLRWRLTRNQWSRAGRLSVGISIAVAILLLLIGLGGGFGGLLAGMLGLAQSSPGVMLGVYDALTIAFLFFWTLGILSTIQRSESIDIGRILHLPVSLKGIFLINYVASHVTLSIVVFLPAMLGLALGLALGRSWTMIAMVPLILGMLFVTTAWTYYLRGWLVILMRNPRRYHAVVAGITMTFILLAQLPNLLMHLRPRESRSARQTETQAQAETEEQAPRTGIPPAILLAHKLAPPLWVGHGAMALATGNPLPALLAAAASFGIGILGLACAYRSTRRFYEGRTEGEKARPAREERIATTAVRKNLLEWRLPGLPEEAGATALASLQSLRRATEVKMALAHNVVMLLVFGGMGLFSHRRDFGLQAQFFYSSGIALLPFMGMIFLMTNQFGFDRAGFRTLVLSPMPRARILLGKNLALLPVAVVLGSVYLALAFFVLRLEAIMVAAALMQLVAAFFLLCIPANLISSLLPYRVRAGALAATKVGAARALLNFLAHMGCMAILSLVLLPAIAAFLMFSAHGLTARLVYLGLSLVELAAIVAVYHLTLPGVGEVLLKREKEILRIVTQEVE